MRKQDYIFLINRILIQLPTSELKRILKCFYDSLEVVDDE